VSRAQPTAEMVRDLWKHMNETFRAKTFEKASAAEMRVIGWALDLMGIRDQGRFLKHSATTVGRRVYVPFELGEAVGGWTLWEQIKTCVHEHQHIAQNDREGPVRFAWRYLRDKADRAVFEAEARTAEMELDLWRNGALPPESTWVKGLEAYELGTSQVALAKSLIAARAETIKRGGVLNEASRVALAWLNANAPALRFNANA
jgi:hypothetical protein